MTVPSQALETSPPAPALRSAPGVQLSVEDVFRDHYAYVFRALRGLGVADAEVDDAVQEVFLVVHARLADFDGRARLTTWLYAIAFNVARAHRRKYQRHAPRELTESAAVGGSPEIRVEHREAAALADRLLAAIDEEKREVFVMVEMHQLTAPEVARITGTNVHTVSSRLASARSEFKAAFRRHQATGKGRTA